MGWNTNMKNLWILRKTLYWCSKCFYNNYYPHRMCSGRTIQKIYEFETIPIFLLNRNILPYSCPDMYISYCTIFFKLRFILVSLDFFYIHCIFFRQNIYIFSLQYIIYFRLFLYRILRISLWIITILQKTSLSLVILTIKKILLVSWKVH